MFRDRSKIPVFDIHHGNRSVTSVAPFTGMVLARVRGKGGNGTDDNGAGGATSGIAEIEKAVTIGDNLSVVIDDTQSQLVFPDATTLTATAGVLNTPGTASGGSKNIAGNPPNGDNGGNAPNGELIGPYRFGGLGGLEGAKNNPGQNGGIPGGGAGGGGKNDNGGTGDAGLIALIYYQV